MINGRSILMVLAVPGFLHLASVTLAYDETRPRPTPRENRSYAGFAEIEPRKNHFLVVGDTQSTSHWEFWRERNGRERKLITGEMANRDPAFVVHLGDLTTRGSSAEHWREFDDLHATWLERKVPCFPVLGNHDLYGNDKKALRNFFTRFSHLEHRRWYSFSWRTVGFIMVDSNFSALTEEEIDHQARWYVAELARFEQDRRVEHVIVCCHEPPYTNSRVIAPNRRSLAYFAEPFTRFGKTRLFLSGHGHTYERFGAAGKFFIVSGGGGGPRHMVQVGPRRRRYNDLFPGPELRFFHFCRVEVRGHDLLFSVARLEQDGTFAVADPLTLQGGLREGPAL
jgi:3',5'-cyclic AMP phosphodiesterase CpdA